MIQERKTTYRSVILIILLHLSGIFMSGFTQSKQGDGDVLSTQATDPNAKPDARKQGPKKKKIRYIIRSDTKGTLKGNACFEEATRKLGFEYLIVPEKLPPNRNGFTRFMHNLGVRTVLFFRNGPGWQIRLKKKYKQCRYQYGDFVG